MLRVVLTTHCGGTHSALAHEHSHATFPAPLATACSLLHVGHLLLLLLPLLLTLLLLLPLMLLLTLFLWHCQAKVE